MSDSATGQPKATTREGIRVETAAIFLLRRIISYSVKEQKEYGGVIFIDTASGQIRATGPISAGASANTVDIGQDKVNLGLPQTQRPLAWYHTHPIVMTRSWGFEWDKFEGGDRDISESRQIAGYVCTWDGYIWRFDPAPDAGNDPVSGAILPMGPGAWGKIVNVPRVRVDTRGAVEYVQPAKGMVW